MVVVNVVVFVLIEALINLVLVRVILLVGLSNLRKNISLVITNTFEELKFVLFCNDAFFVINKLHETFKT